jgi:hypothetical protein
MNLAELGAHLSIGEMVIIGGVGVKVLWEVFRNRQQDKDRQQDNKVNSDQHAMIGVAVETTKTDLKKLHDYVTNGVDAPGGGLSVKFMTRGECHLISDRKVRGSG